MPNSPASPRLLGIGDNTVDIYVDEGMQYPGGNAVNVAVLAARLGADTAYLGCLGTDERGDLMRRSLTAEGIDCSHCRRRPGFNSFSRVAHQDGDRVFLGANPGVRYDYLLDAADMRFVAAHDIAHTSIYSGLEAEMPRIRAAAPRLSMDFSEHFDRPNIDPLLALTDIAFLSCPKAGDAECQAIAARVAAAGPALVVVTRGRRGALAFDGQTVHEQGIVPTEPIDTLGAGDALIAGFLVAHLRGFDTPAALRLGAEHAAQACRSKGAFGHGIPWAPDARSALPGREATSSAPHRA